MSVTTRNFALQNTSNHHMFWGAQDLHVYGSSNSRLYQHSDGAFEIIPKTPGEVIGEQVIRPLIDASYHLSCYAIEVITQGVNSIGKIVQRINFPPVAAANRLREDPSTLEKCLSPSLVQAYRITEAGIARGDSKMLEAAHTLYGPFFAECFNEESYNRAFQNYNQNKELHREEKAKLERKLKECEAIYGANSCYVHAKVEREPELFKLDIQKFENGKAITSREWVATQGYLSWSIYVSRWYWQDIFFASDSYNYDTINKKPTSTTRDDL